MFRLACFGQLSVYRDGVLLPPGAIQPRRLGLLAILASAGERAQGRERLAGLLWPDSDEERAKGSLAQALYSLRRDLGAEEAIQGVRDLRLNPEFVECDLWEFEAGQAAGNLEQAAETCRGRFLDGFQLPGLGEFDRWLEGERAAWQARHLDVLERLAAAAEKRDDRGDAVRWWRRAVGLDPHNARTTVRLMRALARGGDRAGALRQAEIYAALIQGDLELPPDPTVAREAAAIRQAESAAQVTGEWPLPGAPAPEPAAPVASLPPVPGTAPVGGDGTGSPGTAETKPPSAIGGVPQGRKAPGIAFRPVALAGIAILVTLAAFAVFRLRSRTAALSGAPATQRVLVVPPRNGTGDSTFSLVGPMVAEWITRGLSETGLVDVIDTRTMLEATRELGDEASVRDLARGAGVSTLVVGSVFRDGDSLRIEARLTDARTGRLIRAIDPVLAPVSRPTVALEPLRQRVTGALAVLFDDRLHNFTATSSQPPTWEAYQEFLLGMRDFGADYESSLAHFRRAVALDSTYWQARLWAGSASANTRHYPSADSIFRSLASVRDRLAPYDRATLDYFEGGFVRGDWEASYVAAKRMVELAPGAGHALWALGNTAQPTNRPAEAIAAFGRIDLEHGWGRTWALRILNVVGRCYHRLGQYEQERETGQRMRELEEGAGWTRITELRALAALKRTEELKLRVENAYALPATETTWDPYSPGDMLLQVARELEAHGDSATAVTLLARADRWYRDLPERERESAGNRRARARVLAGMGRWREAGEIYSALARTDSLTLEHLGGIGLAAAHAGDTATAVRWLDRLQSDTSHYRFGQPALWAARIAATLHRQEEAVALLHRSLQGGLARGYLLHSDPDLAGLRTFRPFLELLRPRG